ncbi:DUF1810 domain-containing protein [Enterovirga sp. CN4-39]|uniref:DUF1810 domain-containing protein n=1 Tax=Enterovirga sp. CN4-39 TaxID=3400910 RepID=UPI003C03C902
MTEPDPFRLQRFVAAQDGVWERALGELRDGQKRSHWMWFVFPQLAGLGISPTAQFYGISGLDEAEAYLAHPLLGQRLLACTGAVLDLQGRTLHAIFGKPDDLKFRSSMTLFDRAGHSQAAVFRTALDRYCGGEADPRTLALLGG